MGRKKKDAPTAKPFCYYCDREFENEMVLLQHQQARHFSCPICHKKFKTANSMATHALQVHKETITKVPNALKGRDSLALSIYGMEGVPPSLLAERGYEPNKKAKIETESAIDASKLTMDPAVSLGNTMAVTMQMARFGNMAGRGMNPMMLNNMAMNSMMMMSNMAAMGGMNMNNMGMRGMTPMRGNMPQMGNQMNPRGGPGGMNGMSNMGNRPPTNMPMNMGMSNMNMRGQMMRPNMMNGNNQNGNNHNNNNHYGNHGPNNGRTSNSQLGMNSNTSNFSPHKSSKPPNEYGSQTSGFNAGTNAPMNSNFSIQEPSKGSLASQLAADGQKTTVSGPSGGVNPNITTEMAALNAKDREAHDEEVKQISATATGEGVSGENEDDEDDDDEEEEDDDDRYPYSDGRRVYLDADSTLMTADLEASCEELRAKLPKYLAQAQSQFYEISV